MRKKIIYSIRDIIKETAEQRNDRLEKTRSTQTKVIPQKKGKGPYVRSNDYKKNF